MNEELRSLFQRLREHAHKHGCSVHDIDSYCSEGEALLGEQAASIPSTPYYSGPDSEFIEVDEED